MLAKISSSKRLPDPPTGWIRCGVCNWPVRKDCYTRGFPPERKHSGDSLDAFVHQEACPSVVEMETVPGLREATPGWQANSSLTVREVTKRKTKQRGKKKPAEATKMGMAKKARVVKKTPAGKTSKNNALAMHKKPAKSMLA